MEDEWRSRPVPQCELSAVAKRTQGPEEKGPEEQEGEEEEEKSERVCLEHACLSQLERSNNKTMRMSWANKKQIRRDPGTLLDRQSDPLTTDYCWVGW